jgi:hypothetical protein
MVLHYFTFSTLGLICEDGVCVPPEEECTEDTCFDDTTVAQCIDGQIVNTPCEEGLLFKCCFIIYLYHKV